MWDNRKFGNLGNVEYFTPPPPFQLPRVGIDNVQSLLLLFQEIKMATYWSMIIGSLKYMRN